MSDRNFIICPQKAVIIRVQILRRSRQTHDIPGKALIADALLLVAHSAYGACRRCDLFFIFYLLIRRLRADFVHQAEKIKPEQSYLAEPVYPRYIFILGTYNDVITFLLLVRNLFYGAKQMNLADIQQFFHRRAVRRLP